MKNKNHLLTTALALMTTLQSFAQAPVPVKKDPDHRIVFQNKLVTIIYPRILPGDTTSYHIHETPSVFLIMRDARVFDQTLGKPGETFFSSKGETWYNEFYKRQTHRIANIDSVDHQSILIELPNEPKKKYPDRIAGLPKPEYFERVRIYPLKLEAGGSLDLKTTTTPAILIAYKGNLSMKEKGKTLILKQADLKWIEEDSNIVFTNDEQESVEGYIYEIRK